MSRVFGVLCGSVLLTFGCGGGDKPPPKAPVSEAPKESEPVEAIEPAVDLSPVAAPRDLVLTGRLSRPLTVADTAMRWAGLPVSLRQSLPPDARWAEDVVAWDSPVQVAGVLRDSHGEPDLDAVVTVGLTSTQAAVAAARKQGMGVRKVSTGVFQIQGEHPSCAIAAARGPAPARLVCGEDFRTVERLLPYATRGLPDVSSSKSDLEVEVLGEPFQRLFAQQISSLTFLSGFLIRKASLDNQRFDRAFADAVYALAGEAQALALDADRIRLEGKLDDTSGMLDLALSLKLRTGNSWTGQALRDMAQRSNVPPGSFWGLPGPSTSASFTWGFDPKRYKPIWQNFGELAEGYLEHEKIGRATRAKVRAVFTDFEAVSGVVAQGRGGTTPLDTWSLSVIDAPAAPIVKMYRDLHLAFTDPELRKFVTKSLGMEAKDLPTSTFKPFTGKGVPAGAQAWSLTLPANLAAKLPPGAAVRLGLPLQGAGKPKAVKISLVIVPDGERRTLIALSSEPKDAGTLIADFKAGKAPTLSGNRELEPLRTQRAWGGWFMSLATFASTLSAAMDQNQDPQKLLGGLPHHGQTPIFGQMLVEDREGVTLKMTTRVPKAVVEDAAALVPSFAGKF